MSKKKKSKKIFGVSKKKLDEMGMGYLKYLEKQDSCGDCKGCTGSDERELPEEAAESLKEYRTTIYKNMIKDVEEVASYFDGLDPRISSFVKGTIGFFLDIEKDDTYSFRIDAISYKKKSNEICIPIYVTYSDYTFCDFNIGVKKEKKSIKVKIDVSRRDAFAKTRVVATFPMK